ncbi:MAG: metal ABC transporter ATP-binding protein [Phycisphaerales bacterium]|nr:metal ABC transporter ATP-binding protein [Phycisphaerales bacterium]
MTAAVEIKSISYTYPATGLDSSSVNALDSVSLSIDHRTKLGILGPNGGGKSTLIKLILGILKPTSGSIQVLGHSPTKARQLGLVGYLPQRIEAQLDWPISVRQTVALGCTAHLKPWKKATAEDNAAIDRALELVELSDLADRPIGALSGGQLQRTMIARAIARSPKLLVLDEPTVGVDIAGQQRFGQLINTLHEELDLTLIVVSHDMRAVAAVADRVACLSRSLHFHDAPEGLTPAVLAQVFAHDVAGVFGDLHIDAHRADDCDDPTHSHASDSCCDHNSGGAS